MVTIAAVVTCILLAALAFIQGLLAGVRCSPRPSRVASTAHITPDKGARTVDGGDDGAG
jgi:hypothetical protein